MPVYGKTTSTDEGVSPLSSNTPIIGQKLYVVMGLVGLKAILLLICLLLLHKHKLKRHNRMRANQGSRVLPLVSESVNMKCSDQSDNSGSNRPRTLRKRDWWGPLFSMSELETATNRFAKENLIGEGLYGIVYKGYLQDGSVVAVKNLTCSSRGEAKKIFDVEVEAFGNLTHRYLVKLIGFCKEGAKRSLVYEYVDNGNLEKWLHGDIGATSPLTWDIRMKIAIVIAKGLAYLHQGMKPKVVHCNVKSSNILVDKNWNAKLADFGLAKLLKPETEKRYASMAMGMSYEESDIYSFGVLLMEIVTGKSPRGEMNLVDWFKRMVESGQGKRLLDPKIRVRPSQRALARALLVCLRCIDVSNRLTMEQVVFLLEADESRFYREPQPDIANRVLVHMPLLNFLYRRVKMN